MTEAAAEHVAEDAAGDVRQRIGAMTVVPGADALCCAWMGSIP